MEIVWDLRAFKKPLAVRSDVGTLYPNTNAMFSPDDKYVITGAAATTKGGKGHLLFMEKDTLDVVKTLDVDSTPVKVFWHSKINQACIDTSAFRWIPSLTRAFVDCHWPLERSNMCAILTTNLT